jgi:hypothetical protein
MTNGKQKGSGFEREVSKRLSLWWSNHEKDDLFWRSQNSGGRWTSRRKIGVNTDGQAGDICSTSDESKLLIDNFVIECKSYSDINLWSMITDSKGTLVNWWIKVNEEAEHDSKHPILIAKQNQKPILIFVDEFFREIIDENKTIQPILIWNYTRTVSIYRFEEFLMLDCEMVRNRLMVKK